MDNIHYFCQGESHKSNDKPCQDYAYSESSKTLSMAIVSDGHGGERYFRSHIGSKLAVNITRDAIRTFVQNIKEEFADGKNGTVIFEGQPFTSFSQASATEEHYSSKVHKSLTWLFSSIISQWNIAIARDAREHELSQWEIENVEQQYIDDFKAKLEQDNASFEKTYGCTLMAYVSTPKYWFAFHLGDGKCISLHLNNGEITLSQPIPWDEKCFLNKTTSLCDSYALNEFRYCLQGDNPNDFPIAIFLGSDGLDDTFGDGENLYNFYIQLFKIIIKDGKDVALKELSESLPILSQKGSKDDMSVACIYSTENLKTILPKLVEYQLKVSTEKFNRIEDKILDLENKLSNWEDMGNIGQKEKINIEYARKDLTKSKEQAKLFHNKIEILKHELTDGVNDLE